MRLFCFLIPCLLLFSCGQQTRDGVGQEGNTNTPQVFDTLGTCEKLDVLAAKMNAISGIIDSLTMLNKIQAQEIDLLKSAIKVAVNSDSKSVTSLMKYHEDDMKMLKKQIKDMYQKIKDQDDRLMGKSASYSSNDNLYNLKDKVKEFEDRIRKMESDIRDMKRSR